MQINNDMVRALSPGADAAHAAARTKTQETIICEAARILDGGA
jgi:hypothetical protein